MSLPTKIEDFSENQIKSYIEFDESLYDECDPIAREKAKKLVRLTGKYHAEDNPNIKGVDLLMFDHHGNYIRDIEVEVSKRWEGAVYTSPLFGAFTAPFRKIKFFRENSCIYIMFNNDLTWYIWVAGKQFIDVNHIIWFSNNRSSKKEPFLTIPIYDIYTKKYPEGI